MSLKSIRKDSNWLIMLGRELTLVDCSRHVSGKGSVAECRSGRWDFQFHHLR